MSIFTGCASFSPESLRSSFANRALNSLCPRFSCVAFCPVIDCCNCYTVNFYSCYSPRFCGCYTRGMSCSARFTDWALNTRITFYTLNTLRALFAIINRNNVYSVNRNSCNSSCFRGFYNRRVASLSRWTCSPCLTDWTLRSHFSRVTF